MKRLLFLYLLCASVHSQTVPLRRTEFANPPASYRPSPFWSWNSALDDDELRRQVRDFASRGYGGYFMHSRVGLVTRYLSDEWFAKIGVALDEGRKAGLESWLYDEDKWPSGFAGGLATSGHPEFAAMGMNYKVIPPGEVAAAVKAPNTLGVFIIDGDEFEPVNEAAAASGKETLWFFFEPAPKSNWYNGETYLDVLNPEAVARFLQLTFDQGYARRFQKDFGPAMPGVFTDEPNYGVGAGRGFPWTKDFAQVFEKKRGYSVLEGLPLLVRNLPGHREVRYDFWRTAAELFEEAYSKQYGETAARLGLKLTGHYLAEDTMGSQTRVTGSVMLHYRHQQMPGIDHLRRNIDDPLTLKQVSSVAHQYGRPRSLCEIYGVSGHSASFEDLKWIADYHFALGVNFLVPHLTLYSMTGDRKRDYPPTFSYHQPYWESMKVLNDYLARAAYFTSSGRPHKEILLLHPLGSAWSEFSPGPPQEPVAQIDQKFAATIQALLGMHRDFDLGDEVLLNREGKVADGVLHAGTAGRYHVVVVPPAYRWNEETINMLMDFIRGGGRVIFRGRQPLSIQPLLLRTGVVRIGEEPDDLDRALDLAHPRDVSITGPDSRQATDIYYQHQTDGARHLYFLANTNREKALNISIGATPAGSYEEWDLGTGAVRPMKTLRREIPPAGSLAFVIDTTQPPTVFTNPAPAAPGPAPQKIATFRFRRLQPNTLVLDRCRYSVNDAALASPVPVWRARNAVFTAAGLDPVRGIQPWALEWKNIHPSGSAHFKMQFEFTSEIDLEKGWLVVEKAENFEIRFNGEKTAPADGWQWDRQFGRVPVRVRRGSNTVELGAAYRTGLEVEDIFLIGDFATRKISDTEYSLVAEPAQLAGGNWVGQGYHFYSGNMAYQFPVVFRKGERVTLRLDQPVGTVIRVMVDGRAGPSLGWQPWEADLTSVLRPGENNVEVIVESSLQNTFGPLHNDRYKTEGNNWWFGPESFSDARHWTDAYYHAPYGLGGVQVVTVKPAKD